VKAETIGIDEIELEEHMELELHNSNVLYLSKIFLFISCIYEKIILNFIYFRCSYLFYIYYKR
jgi:hypothetical protein